MPGKTPDCGPHCKVVTRRRAGGKVVTQSLKHCNRRKCQECHSKPVVR